MVAPGRGRLWGVVAALILCWAGCGRLGYDPVDAGERDGSMDAGLRDGSPRDGARADAGLDGGPDADGTPIMSCRGACTCRTGESCLFECDRPCEVTCEAGSACSVECASGASDMCVINCFRTASCRLDCGGGVCMAGPSLAAGIVCESGGTCSLAL